MAESICVSNRIIWKMVFGHFFLTQLQLLTLHIRHRVCYCVSACLGASQPHKQMEVVSSSPNRNKKLLYFCALGVLQSDVILMKAASSTE